MPSEVGALVVSSSSVVVFTLLAEIVNSVVDQPYLDEQFHLPQAQRYCKGDYDSYDPKLTTPPGLYYISAGLAKLIYSFRQFLPLAASLESPPCISPRQLRYTSLLSLLILPCLLGLYRLDNRIKLIERNGAEPLHTPSTMKLASPTEAMTIAMANPSESASIARRSVSTRQAKAAQKRRGGILGALSYQWESLPSTLEMYTISMLPPLWFFGFLYYTDVPSTALVMAMFIAAKRRYCLFASLLGCASLTLRQTNIVWILFAMGTSTLEELRTLGLSNGPLAEESAITQLRSVTTLPWKSVVRMTTKLLGSFSPVAILSVTFFLRNGRIVLGDQDNHQASLHWAQPLYCVTMLTIFAWPALFSSVSGTSKVSSARWIRTIPLFCLFTVISLTAIYYGTIAHPFLLADNRHYTFYIWRRIINRTWYSRYIFAPAYSIMLRIWWTALAQENSLFWIVGFSLCTCAAIIPSPLIEPRYFLIPYLVARLHLFSDFTVDDQVLQSDQARHKSRKERRIDLRALVLEAIWYLTINAATMYLFLYRPFTWPDSSQWQRFMW